MAELPEIGTLSNKAVAKLAGLAPIAHDSGQRAGKRPVRAGRVGVRSILFVVAEIVRRYDPDFKAFHRKLSDAGKTVAHPNPLRPEGRRGTLTLCAGVLARLSQLTLDSGDFAAPTGSVSY